MLYVSYVGMCGCAWWHQVCRGTNYVILMFILIIRCLVLIIKRMVGEVTSFWRFHGIYMYWDSFLSSLNAFQMKTSNWVSNVCFCIYFKFICLQYQNLTPDASSNAFPSPSRPPSHRPIQRCDNMKRNIFLQLKAKLVGIFHWVCPIVFNKDKRIFMKKKGAPA